MSEHDSDASSRLEDASFRLEAALREQLARREERICMLEALLEETRHPTETTEHVRRGDSAAAEDLPASGQPGGAIAYPTPARVPTPATARQGGAMAFTSQARQPSGGAIAYETPVSSAHETPAAGQMEPEQISSEQAVENALVPAAGRVSPVERKPIALPTFAGSGVEAIADAVLARASARAQTAVQPIFLSSEASAHTPRDAEAQEIGYEPTARFPVPFRNRRPTNAMPRRSLLRTAGSLALLSVGIAALGVGAWQVHRLNALSSAASHALSPLPLLTPPPPLPSRLSRHATMVSAHPASQPRSAHGPTASRTLAPVSPSPASKTPIIEPLEEEPESLRAQHRRASGFVAVPSPSLPAATKPAGRSHARFARSGGAVIATSRPVHASGEIAAHHSSAQEIHNGSETGSALREEQDRFASPARHSRAQEADARDARDNPPQTVEADTPDESRPRAFENPNADRADDSSTAPEARRRSRRRRLDNYGSPQRRQEAYDSYKVTQPSNEELPRRRSQQVRRAMHTLDEMQDLLDSIERRKRRQTNDSSE